MAESKWRSDYLPLWIGGAIRGRVRGDVVPGLRGMSEIDSAEVGLRLREQTGGLASAAALRAACRARSRALQSVAQQLHRAGLIADWRNEASALLDEQGVAVVAGEGFGCPGFIRISFARSQDELRRGLAALAAFIDSLGIKPQALPTARTGAGAKKARR